MKILFPLLLILIPILALAAGPNDSLPIFYHIEVGDSFFHPTFTTRIQTVTASTASNVNTLAVTIAATQANSLIVVAASTSGSVVPTVTDSAAQSYTQVNSFNTANTTAFFYKAGSAAGVTTVTMNFTGTASQANIIVAEYSGIATSSPLDQNTSQNQTGVTSFTSGSTSATTQSNELIIGNHFAHAHPSGAWGAGTNFVTVNSIFNAGQNMNSFLQEDYVEATGAQAATGTIGASDNIFSGVSTFKILNNTLPAGFTLTGAATTIRSGAGTLKKVTVNTSGATGSTIKLYDGSPTTGILMASIDASQTPRTYEYNAAFSTSLTLVMNSPTPDAIITYQTVQ